MPELVGFQTMVILDPYGMTIDAVGVFGLDFQLLFKSGSSYCELFKWGHSKSTPCPLNANVQLFASLNANCDYESRFLVQSEWQLNLLVSLKKELLQY